MANGNETTDICGSATLVTETGVAFLHKGELIVPFECFEAGLEDISIDSSTVVQYVFPVEIEVRSVGTELDPDSIADATLDALVEGLAAL